MRCKRGVQFYSYNDSRNTKIKEIYVFFMSNSHFNNSPMQNETFTEAIKAILYKVCLLVDNVGKCEFDK